MVDRLNDHWTEIDEDSDPGESNGHTARTAAEHAADALDEAEPDTDDLHVRATWRAVAAFAVAGVAAFLLGWLLIDATRIPDPEPVEEKTEELTIPQIEYRKLREETDEWLKD